MIAFFARFAALTVVMLVPLILGELSVLRIQRIPTKEMVDEMNDINLGVRACRHDMHIPWSNEDANKLTAMGLLTPAQIQDRMVKCESPACVNVLIEKMRTALLKYVSWDPEYWRSASNLNSGGDIRLVHRRRSLWTTDHQFAPK